MDADQQNEMAKKAISKNYMGRNPGRAKKERPLTRCPVCGAPLQMVHRDEMGFRFVPQAKAHQFDFYWRCSNYPRCDTYTPADPKTKKPWGLPANRDTRYKRMLIHVWQQELVNARAHTPTSFRQMCGSQIGRYNQETVHTRFMTEMQCDTVLNHLKRLYENNERIHSIVEARPFTSIWNELHGLASADDPYAFFNLNGEKVERPPHLYNRDKASISPSHVPTAQEKADAPSEGSSCLRTDAKEGEQNRNSAEQKKD